MPQTGQNTQVKKKMLKSNVLPNHLSSGGIVPENNVLFDVTGTVSSNNFFCLNCPVKLKIIYQDCSAE